MNLTTIKVKELKNIPRLTEMIQKDYAFNFICYDSGSCLIVYERVVGVIEKITLEIMFDMDKHPTLFHCDTISNLIEIDNTVYAVRVYEEEADDLISDYEWIKQN